MEIELELVDIFDGLTRVLQILRLTGCEVRELRAVARPSGCNLRLTVVVVEERKDSVVKRMGQVVGVSALRMATPAGTARSCPQSPWSAAA